MAKQGMARPDWTKRPKNTAPVVPELQGKVKTGKKQAPPIVTGTSGPDMKVYHVPSHRERPISSVYPVLDTDLARDNVENDLTLADLQDL